MTLAFIDLVPIILVFILYFAGLPIVYSLFGGAFFYFLFIDSTTQPYMVMMKVMNSTASYSLLAIPFFVMSGSIMNYGGIADKLMDFAEIITMTGGKAALAEMTHGKLPDIIVSDVNMPDGDGFWLCNQLKSNEKLSHIPFVLLTARGEAQSQSESYRLGADGFLAKPFEIETLMELIRGLLKRKAEIRKDNLEKYLS